MNIEEPSNNEPDDRCPACHDTECCGVGPIMRDEAILKIRKALSTLRHTSDYTRRIAESSAGEAFGHLSATVDHVTREICSALRMDK